MTASQPFLGTIEHLQAGGEHVHATLQGLQGQRIQACTDAQATAQQAVDHTKSAGSGELRIAPAIQAKAFPGRLG